MGENPRLPSGAVSDHVALSSFDTGVEDVPISFHFHRKTVAGELSGL